MSGPQRHLRRTGAISIRAAYRRFAARAPESGQAATVPPTSEMKSRRRIALPQGSGVRQQWLITSGICDRRNGVQGSGCTATILRRPCPLWVKSRHCGTSNQCPLYPQKRTLELSPGMSAKCQKQTFYAAPKRSLPGLRFLCVSPHKLVTALQALGRPDCVQIVKFRNRLGARR